MEQTRWEQICEVYDEALNLPAEERTSLVKQRCAGDLSLVFEVESLLAAAEQPGFLDSNVAELDEFHPSALIAGRFRIVRLLGRGGMGQVYEAHDLHLGEHVALKTIRPELASDVSFVERFKNEIQIAKKVTHRNVCRIYDVGFHPSPDDPHARMFLTMELLSGQTLTERLAAGPIKAKEAFPLIEQLAEGLEAAHQVGVIHRDFKTSNIMVTADRGHVRAVITDFGLARALELGHSPGAPLVRLGEVAGTPEYMAPEQLIGGAITPATDIYSFGIVIFEMVTGQRPFQDELPLKAAMRRLQEAPPSAKRLVPALQQNWAAAISRCLSLRPEDRFPSPPDLIAALGRSRKTKNKYSFASRALIGIAAALVLCVSAWLLPHKRHLIEPSEWQQLTNFGDAATDPAFSPDGRMLTFKRGGNWFMSPGQIYVKMLPDGTPIQLTSDPAQKMDPQFSPDGSRVAYSTTMPGLANWAIAQVSASPDSVAPEVILSNAEGLNWIDKSHILFGENRLPKGPMAIVTATETRTDKRDVYVPGNWTQMARFSSISPDHKQVLIVEMEPGAGTNWSEFFPCRVVPFDGKSKGRQVGPIPGHCIGAAWSPDGKWMYFSARTSDKFHLWRQPARGGEAEQITSGPTEEKEFALAPDGRSVVASVGSDQSTVWLHDNNGEQQISVDGNGRSPRFSPDGRKIYYLWAPDLWSTELRTGRPQRVLPGVAVTSYYAVSPDGHGIAYSSPDGGLWYCDIDRPSKPRKLVSDGTAPEFALNGDIFYRSRDLVFCRISKDGTHKQDLTKDYGNTGVPISAVSPDGKWAIREADDWNLRAYSRSGDRAVPICDRCVAGWSPNGRFFWIVFKYSGKNGMAGLIPLENSDLPPLPTEGIKVQADLNTVPGVRVVSYQGYVQGVSPAPDGASYAFVRQESHWNLYRIPLP